MQTVPKTPPLSFPGFYNLPALNLGLIPYAEGRRIQNEYVQRRIRGECEDVLLYCEHPPTLTIGKRCNASESGLSNSEWQTQGVQLEYVDRGGGVTFHAPGQLLIYPVVHLRERRVGIKQFVSEGLAAIAEAVSLAGLDAQWTLEPAGVFAASKNAPRDWYKLAFVGLRVVSGVTNHGFSVNIDCNLEPFAKFTPCGQSGLKVSSIAQLRAR